MLSHLNKKINYAGDTIVEVLMAIAIAAFAIGTSYAIANRSLQHAISARERNEAVNLMEDQIANLKVRYKASPDAFKSDDPTKGFVVTSTYSTVNVPEFHFCLADNIKGKDDPLWARSPNQTNVFSSTVTPDDLKIGTAGSGYNINCKRNFGGTDFFVDIEAYITPASQGLANKTVYRVNVRWPEIGTGQKNNAVVYYRLPSGNTPASVTGPGSSPGPGILPPSCTSQYYNIVIAFDNSESMSYPFVNDPLGRSKLAVAKDAANVLVDEFNLASAQNQMGFIELNYADWTQTAKILNNLTSDTSALHSTINGLTYFSGTYYLDALDKSDAVASAGSPANGKVIIFMSDGEPYDDGDPPPTNISSYDNIIQKAQGLWAKGDVIYTVGIDTPSITTAPAESILKAMAGGNGPGGITGGYTVVENKADFDVLVNNLVNKLTC